MGHPVTLGWNANTETISTYRVYYGTATGVYNDPASPVDMGNVLQGSVIINTTATYFFALTAVDTNNLESGFSSEVSLAVNVDLPPGAGMGAFEGIGSLAAF